MHWLIPSGCQRKDWTPQKHSVLNKGETSWPNESRSFQKHLRTIAQSLVTAVSQGHFPDSHPAHSPQKCSQLCPLPHRATSPQTIHAELQKWHRCFWNPMTSLVFTSPFPSHPHFFLPLPGLLWEPYLILNSSQKVHNISNWRGLETSSPIFFSCRKGNWGLKRLKNLPKSCDFWIRTCRGSEQVAPR